MAGDAPDCLLSGIRAGLRPAGAQRLRGPCPYPGPCDAKRHPRDDAFSVLLEGVAEQRGAFVCMRCGVRGKIRDGGLYRTDLGPRPVAPSGVDRPRPLIRPAPALPPPQLPGRIPERYEQALRQMHEISRGLYPGSPAEAYLRGRGIRAADAGYLPAGYCLRDVDRDALVALNIVHEAGYVKTHWRERVLFPFSWEGRLTCFSGRVLGEVADGVPKFLTTRTYAPGEHGGELRWFKGVYNAAALRGASRITVVEGAIDACALLELALPELSRPIALSGKELSAPVRRWLQGKPRLEVVLAFDRDEAGREAAAEWTRELGEHRVCTCHPPTPHKDWADMCSAFVKAFPASLLPPQPPR
jgi:hypothetical protein